MRLFPLYIYYLFLCCCISLKRNFSRSSWCFLFFFPTLTCHAALPCIEILGSPSDVASFCWGVVAAQVLRRHLSHPQSLQACCILRIQAAGLRWWPQFHPLAIVIPYSCSLLKCEVETQEREAAGINHSRPGRWVGPGLKCLKIKWLKKCSFISRRVVFVNRALDDLGGIGFRSILIEQMFPVIA